MFRVDGEYPVGQSVVKSVVKHLIEKPILLSFVNLPGTLCPRLERLTIILPRVGGYTDYLCMDTKRNFSIKNYEELKNLWILEY